MKKHYPIRFLILLLLLSGRVLKAQNPAITGVSPLPNAKNVIRNSAVEATFDQSLTNESAPALKVFSAQRGGLRSRGATPATVSGNTLRFTPGNYDYVAGERVNVSMTTAVTATAGGTLASPNVRQFIAATGGTGQGNFQPGANASVTGYFPGKSVLGDLDGDGDLDLVTAVGNLACVRFNNGTGAFSGSTNVFIGNNSIADLELGDIDGDGDLDLLSAIRVSDGSIVVSVIIRINNGSGNFSTPPNVDIAPNLASLTMGDIDGDGDLDLLALTVQIYGSAMVHVRFNDGTGTFSGSSSYIVSTGVEGRVDFAREVVLGDVDNDGDLDFLVPRQGDNAVFVFRNDGRGVFSPGSQVDVGNDPQSVAVGDIDGDGDLDLATADRLSNAVSVRTNDGAGLFSGTTALPVGVQPGTVAMGDIDADGDLDLLVANTNSGTMSVLLNSGTGTFTPPVFNPTPSSLAQHFTLGDLDGDSDLDFVATDNGTSNTVAIHFNEPVPPNRLYVKANASGANTGLNWTDAFPDLQSALTYSNADNLSEIWVAQGTYKPTSTTGSDSRGISFSMLPNVAIYGGFAGNETSLSERPAINPKTGQPSSSTLSGDIGSPGSTADNSYHVINNPSSRGLTGTAVLDGFVITAGNANGSLQNAHGAGMVNDGSGADEVCSPAIQNCWFINNTANSAGGVMYNNGSNSGNSSPVVTNCVFQNNSGRVGGAVYNNAEGGTTLSQFINCSFQSNSAQNDGGAMHNNGTSSGNSRPQITNTLFQSNRADYGGAIRNSAISGVCVPVLTNCVFQSNTASAGGGALYNDGSSQGNSSPVLTNCVFQRNSAGGAGGGAILNYAISGLSTPALNTCTFQGNTTSGSGGALYNYSSGSGNPNVRPLLTNCIVFDNGGENAIHNINANSGTSVRYSLIEAGETSFTTTAGTTLTVDPRFVDEANGNLSLQGCSPAIDAGDPASTTASLGATDLAGNARIFNNERVDLGAYEFQGSIAQVGISSSPVAASVVCAGGTVTVGVSVTSSGGTPGYQWYRNAIVVTGQTTATLSLTNVQPGDAGSYSLVVTTACQSLTSTAFSLTITALSAVTISASPSLSIASGSTVTLTASGADGYHWSSGDVTAAISVSTAGPYSVTGTTSGCSSVTSVTVFESTPVPTVTGSFDGFIYGADCATFRGWIWDRNKPNAVITIDILDGATVVATIPAGEFRQDLLDQGKGNGRHAFFWSIPDALKDGLPHSLSARVTGNSFVLRDSPKVLICEPNTTPGGNKPPQPPTPTVLIAPLVAQVGVPFSGTLVAFTDPEGAALTYNLTGLPAGLSLEMPNRIISGTPTESGTFVLTYQATDGPGASNSVSFQLTVNPAETTTVTGSFEGYLDKLDCGGIRGWVWDRNKPNTPLTVEFYTESSPGSITVLGSTLANIYRQDLKDAGKGNGSHAYNFTPPVSVTNGTPVRARVLGSSYLLKGSPKTYQCAGARLSAEANPVFGVVVMGNPIRDHLDLEIRGAEGQPLTMQITDVQGRLVGERYISRAGVVEQVRLSVAGQLAGLLVVRVQVAGQVKTVNVLKTH